ncbi:MAG: Ig-like domain-containing protein [Verrucomicrobia bacterium]|nr:Ig-like domain-containing protein [Verrucomicrobiota bacterium]
MNPAKTIPSICRFATRNLFPFTLLGCALLAPNIRAQDTWDLLPDVPFPYGISAGGGLAPDATFLYAADLSGDGGADFIDLNNDGNFSPGEALQELGIPNGSVRFARLDPATGTWATLPTLHPTGVAGDNFSAGDLTGGLFVAGGRLFYYQYRAGPNRCALYNYDLAQGLTGSWAEVWNLTPSEALLDLNAGMVGVDTVSGPAILHHTGGGGYQFARATGLTNGSPVHTLLTPSWPFSEAHFPRNGSWAYDRLRGRLFHMSGNQLLQWEPNAAYAPAGLLEALPNGTDDLALPSTRITSLKNTLGWNPGGPEGDPGVSLWGNSIVVVNDPTGHAGGPGGEDTGANVLYLTRGETSVDGWPFNEGRGLVNNGHFARFFPGTGAAQSLPDAPFHIGKGSAAAYLNGWVYLTQGETRTSADDTGNVSPLNGDGVRYPGKGFARFGIRPTTIPGSPILPLREHLAAGFVTLIAPSDTGTSTAPLFDQNWDSLFQAATNNPADVIIEFSGATSVGAARARFGDTTHEWSLAAANSLADLTAGMGSFTNLCGPLTVTNGEVAWREWNATPVTRRYFRFRVARPSGSPVEIRELELQRPKPVHTIVIGGDSVAVNHLEITPVNPTVLSGGTLALFAEASLSLGPQRYNVSTQAVWSSSAAAVATVGATGLVSALSVGEARIGSVFDALSATTRVAVVTVTAQDDDVAVGWIQRLPSLPYTWGSTNATRQGWPAAGAPVTWRAQVKNWYPFVRTNVGYRWLVNGAVAASGTTDLAPRAWTGVDLARPWSFTRETLRFEVDPENVLPEFSETNNTVSTWTDAITVGFWVEQTVYDYFHQHQHELGDGANGWEDWAQRQVARWNAMFAAAVDPIDAPQGVLDRIRIDKITLLPDGALPLAGGIAGNNPDNNDRTVDLVWGFQSAGLLSGDFYANHTDRADWNAFYYEGSLIHELGHARYLIDGYGFNVGDTADNPRVFVQHNGQPIGGTPWLPRSYPWWDHVHIMQSGVGNPFDGLMGSYYTSIDRYSAVALNRIAGRRAVEGNFNAPYNIGAFMNDLPATNQIQLLDGHGQPIAGATVSVYRASGTSEWYGKQFDDTPDLTFTADTLGRVNVGRNPFSDGPLQHTYGISTMVALLKAEAGGRTGFAFLKAGLFNLEYWRGNTNQGRYSLVFPMLGATRELAAVRSWPEGDGWRGQVITGGDTQPDSVTVAGEDAFFQEGSWWVWVPGGAGPRLIATKWPATPAVQEWVNFPTAAPARPTLALQSAPGTPSQLEITWPTLLGYAFDLEISDDLLNWTLAPNSRVFGVGDPFTSIRPKNAPQNFFRLQVYRLGD